MVGRSFQQFAKGTLFRNIDLKMHVLIYNELCMQNAIVKFAVCSSYLLCSRILLCSKAIQAIHNASLKSRQHEAQRREKWHVVVGGGK